MTLHFHPSVQSDFNEAIARYESVVGSHLADRFEAEFRQCLAALQAGPTRFPFYQQSRVFRRVRLRHFPYLIVYREVANGVRITLLKHEQRHPLHGMTRW